MPIEKLFKRVNFYVDKAHMCSINWNDTQLRIATETRFSWYIAINATVL